MINSSQHTLPAAWASALVNGDNSGIESYEKSFLLQWLDNNQDLGLCVSCSEEVFISTTLVYGRPLQCECLDYTFHHPS